MAESKTDLVVRLSAENKKLQRDLNQAKRKLNRFSADTNKIMSNVSGYFIGAFGAATVLQGLKAATQAYDKQAKAIAQVEAGLKATGGTVGRTLKELEASASSLQQKTIFGDEEILRGVTSQLLTFTNITTNAFDRTQQAVLDVSTRIGGDLTSTAIMLGKALNDPVANLGALSRSGIQFSKDQKLLIKSLVETNRLAEAQSIILDELETQYGGSAAAAAEAGLGPWQQLGNAIGDFSESVGKLIVKSDGLNTFADALKNVTNSMTAFMNSFADASAMDKLRIALASTFGVGSISSDVIMNTLQRSVADPNAPVGPMQIPRIEIDAPKTTADKDIFGLSDQIEYYEKFVLPSLQKIGIETGKVFNEVPKVIADSVPPVNKNFKEFNAMMDENLVDLSGIVTDLANTAISGFIQGLATDGIEGALNNLLQVMAKGLIQIGELLIAQGIAITAAINLDPVGKIIAGTAAIALGAALSNAISKNASATSNAVGGGRYSGSSSNSIGQTGLNIPNQITLKANGKDLVGVINLTNNNITRTRGV